MFDSFWPEVLKTCIAPIVHKSHMPGFVKYGHIWFGGDYYVIFATCTCTLILAVNVSHMPNCKPAIWLVVQDPELSSQQNQETAQRVPDPFPFLGMGSGHKTKVPRDVDAVHTCTAATGVKQSSFSFATTLRRLRLQDSVLPMHVNYCTRPYNTICLCTWPSMC